MPCDHVSCDPTAIIVDYMAYNLSINLSHRYYTKTIPHNGCDVFHFTQTSDLNRIWFVVFEMHRYILVLREAVITTYSIKSVVPIVCKDEWMTSYTQLYCVALNPFLTMCSIKPRAFGTYRSIFCHPHA
eukprot:122742_1